MNLTRTWGYLHHRQWLITAPFLITATACFWDDARFWPLKSRAVSDRSQLCCQTLIQRTCHAASFQGYSELADSFDIKKKKKVVSHYLMECSSTGTRISSLGSNLFSGYINMNQKWWNLQMAKVSRTVSKDTAVLESDLNYLVNQAYLNEQYFNTAISKLHFRTRDTKHS